MGELQFDLVQSRLAAEYRVETKLDRLTYRSMLRALDPDVSPGGARPGRCAAPSPPATGRQRTVGLFEGPWAEDLFRDKNPGVALARTL